MTTTIDLPPEQDLQETSEPGKRHRVPTSLKITAIAFGVIAAVIAVATFDATQSGKVLPGVRVDGHDVGGRGTTQVRKLVAERLAAAQAQTLTATGRGETFTVPLAQLGLHADVAGTVQRALDGAGTEAGSIDGFTGMFSRTYHRLLNKPLRVQVQTSYTLDPAKVAAFAEQVRVKIDAAPVDAGYKIEGGRFHATPAANGYALDTAALSKTMEQAAIPWTLSGQVPHLDLPMATLAPKVTEEALGTTIFVSRSERRLYHYEGSRLVKTYTVAVGMPGYATPAGTWKVEGKRKNPTWVNPGAAWSAGMPKTIGPGPGNPLGTRALDLTPDGIRIHGTYATGSLGSAASHGCIRMSIHDSEELFDLVQVKDRVIIV